MKFLKLSLFVWTLSVAVSAQLDTSSQHFYMYIYFLDEEAGACIAVGTDGINWVKANNGEPVIQPKIAIGETPLMRDPNTYYDPNTGVFHLVWTTAWNQDNIGYATSKDLLAWSEQIMIPVGRTIKGCQVCWAPEFYYDDQKDSIMVMWSTARGRGGKEAFRSMTKDFKHYTAPKVYFEPHNNYGERYTVIDETLVKVADSTYYMFFKDERQPSEARKQAQNIHYVIGKTPQGPWTKGSWDEVSRPISIPAREGPTAIIIGDELRVYSDPFKEFTSTKRMVKAKLSELSADYFTYQESKFIDGEAMKTSEGNDFLCYHGSISEIPRAKAIQLIYGIPDQTVYSGTWKHPTQSEIFVEAIVVPIDTTGDSIKVYPMGKQNCGLGSGVGLAFLPPIVIRAASLRRRRKRKLRKP